ncbi:hypothetical protein ACFFX0_20065 [Citricoccus parietis]|uniref:Secreted protein n=1 Tax=Citricoccus parietis TaxID=592307 RepID=A0ABV5G356_9MICC
MPASAAWPPQCCTPPGPCMTAWVPSPTWNGATGSCRPVVWTSVSWGNLRLPGLPGPVVPRGSSPAVPPEPSALPWS